PCYMRRSSPTGDASSRPTMRAAGVPSPYRSRSSENCGGAPGGANGRASMSDQMEKLRFSATFVVWASRMLTLGEKVVWYHHWALDRSRPGGSNGDHCYISAASMAERLGLSPYTIEEYRSSLVKMNL